MDQPLFHVVLFFHCLGLIVGFGSALVADAFGFFWVFRKQKPSQIWKVVDTAQTLIWIGWLGMIFSGIPLLIMKTYLDQLIKLKIFLVLLVGINGFFLKAARNAAKKNPDSKNPPAAVAFRLALGTFVSQTGWWGAVIIGFYQRNIEHRVLWPENPWIYMIVTTLFLATALIAGTLLFKTKK